MWAFTVQGRSRSSTITIRNPVYDFLLAISCDLCSLWRRFRDIVQRRKSKATPEPPNPGTPIEFRRQTYHAKSWDISLLFCETAWFSLQLFCHNTLVSQTDRQHVMTVAELCNAISTFGKIVITKTKLNHCAVWVSLKSVWWTVSAGWKTTERNKLVTHASEIVTRHSSSLLYIYHTLLCYTTT